MTILFAGGEDLDFTFLNGFNGATPGSLFGTETTAGRFRSGYARHGIGTNSNLPLTAGNTFFRTGSNNVPPFAATSFWVTARHWSSASTSSTGNFVFFRLNDASGISRVRVRTTSASGWGGPIVLEKVNAAGTVTTLLTSALSFPSLSPAAPDKVDVFVNYTTTGTTFRLYNNGILLLDFAGDLTTDSVTSLGSVDFGVGPSTNGGGAVQATWSEVIVATTDTRTYNLVSQVATANGNTHNFTAGATADIAAAVFTQGDAAPNVSATAGQIQQYQVTPALPAGSFALVSVVHKIRAVAGTTGPQKMDDMIRIGGTDYTSSDIPLTSGWATYSNNWDLNPNTGANWGIGDIVNASTLFNFGVKSVT